MESRTQGSRPRTQKNRRSRPRTAFPKTDPLEAKDRNAGGQDQGHNAEVFSKKKVSRKKLQILRKISGEEKKDHDLCPFLTNQKIVLLSTKDRAFSRTCIGFEAKAKDFKMCPRGRPQGEGRPRRLHL